MTGKPRSIIWEEYILMSGNLIDMLVREAVEV